jgi:putative intracellular protease/amidase
MKRSSQSPLFVLCVAVLLSACGGGSPDPLSDSASSISGAVAGSKCHVLVAMNDASILLALPVKALATESKEFAFGYLLNEMAVPVNALLDAGCKVTFATPRGKQPVRDVQGDQPFYFTDGVRVPGQQARLELKRALALVEDASSPVRGKGLGSFDTPLRFSDLNTPQKLDEYSAIFMPGGYAPMLGLHENDQLGSILRYFNGKNRLTVTLCRGGVALASAAVGRDWVYRGYRMTTYATVEDDAVSVINKILPTHRLPFHPNEKLKELGARLSFSPFKVHVVEDRELLTGENQHTAHALARRFVQRLRNSKP